MGTLTLRGCGEDLEKALKYTSAQRGVSINRLILDTLKETLLGNGKKPRKYHDLDTLAGTWSVAEAAEFNNTVGDYKKIDSELW